VVEVHQETIPSAPSVLVINGVDHAISNVYMGFLEITHARLVWVRPTLAWILALIAVPQHWLAEPLPTVVPVGLSALVVAVELWLPWLRGSTRPETVRVTHRGADSVTLVVTSHIRRPFTAIVHPEMAEYLATQFPDRTTWRFTTRSRVPAKLTSSLARRCDLLTIGAVGVMIVNLWIRGLSLYLTS
jgi:hypothetical protein